MSDEAVLKAVQMRLQAAASRPDGPAEPLPHSAALRMFAPVMLSKITGWHSGVWSVLVGRACWSTDCGGECFAFRASSTYCPCGLIARVLHFVQC